MARRTGVVVGAAVVLATAASVLSAPAVVAADPTTTAAAAAATLPRDIPGGVEVTLADGDLLRVWAARDHRTVWSTRRDAATGAWSERRVVLRGKLLFCGDVDARTAGGAVAAVAECDRHSWSEDQAPTHSRALWTADTVTWSSDRLDGEAYDEPGISPDGQHAVYPDASGYVTRGPEGFTHHRLETPGREYTATATISDTAQVSYLYGASSELSRRCRVVVLTRTGDGAPTRQDLPLADGCSDSDFVNTDSDTTLFGDVSSPALTAVISRPDASSPWAVSRVAPAYAPGLVQVDEGLYTRFVSAPGTPLVALASRTGRRVRAQLYDDAAQSWGAPSVVHESARRCRWGADESARPLAVVAVVADCGGRHVVLTTRDGLAWQALRMGPRSFGQSPDGRYVAVPGSRTTWVVSAELGVVALPVGVTGRCAIAVPDGAEAAVQLVAGTASRAWPTRLRHVSAAGTEPLERIGAPTRGRCTAYEPSYDIASRFDMQSTRTDHGQSVDVVHRADGWTARLHRW
ncbi:hypothetical protein KDN32_13205 [Nocardioides sp. J2M5]|uniref:hypothetical protein n=1 Tax=Nocardioides palaemonis TaxID=2829810 RepID=UPI001BA48D56|nr:hypothetical protein [Nocardioides palaemonis]MBS2938694.1 hypothetical protein [Nocardioides palaemonis]